MKNESFQVSGPDSIPAENSAESRKEHLLESIDNKIELLAAFRERIEKFRSSDSHEFVKSELLAAVVKVESAFPEQEVLLAREYSELKNQISAIRNTYEKASEQDIERNDEKIKNIEDKISVLDDNDTTPFLFEVSKIASGLIEKNKYVKFTKPAQMKADYLALLKSHSAFRKEDTDEFLEFDVKKDIIKCKPAVFDVALFIKNKGLFDALGSRGFHIPGSAFVTIDDTQNNRWAIYQHEKTHNLMDSSDFFTTTMGDKLNSIQTSYNLLLNFKPGYVMYEMGRTNLLKLNADQIIDNYGNEIRAHSDLAPIFGFKDSDRTVKEKMYDSEETLMRKILGEEEPISFEQATSAMATAGRGVSDIVRVLPKYAANIQDPVLKQHLISVSEELREKFTAVVNTIRNTYETIEEKDPKDKIIRPFLLLSIFPPSKYRHVESYLEYKYGSK